MNKKMLPCPFCGGEARIMLEEEDRPDECFHNIYCTSCGVQFWVKSKSEAIAAWNRRTEQESELPASSTPTNAQRIRSMSDEELQKFLHEFESGDIDYAKTFCDLCCKDAALERRSVDCEGCLLWWLKNDAKQPQGLDYWTKQPAETEGTE
jgi:Lar family restriction alleviation protein